jgi:hypothetical protein
VAGGDIAHGRQVVGSADDDARLTLIAGSEEHGHGVAVDRGLEGRSIPVGHRTEAGVNGLKSVVAGSSSEKLMIVMVRPWKLPSATMMLARIRRDAPSPGTPGTCSPGADSTAWPPYSSG